MDGTTRWRLKAKYLYFGDFIERGQIYEGEILETIPPLEPPFVRLRHPADAARTEDVPWQLLEQVS